LRNVTDPVGTPEVAGTTVATNVTSCPSFEGLGNDRSDVVVAWLFTVWTRTLEVLIPCPMSPLYFAVTLCGPTVNEFDERVTTPLFEATKGTVPRLFIPSAKLTEPVGSTPSPVVTVAVKVIRCPAEEGFDDEVSVMLVAGLCNRVAVCAVLGVVLGPGEKVLVCGL
jgi:hypothetical protein